MHEQTRAFLDVAIEFRRNGRLDLKQIASIDDEAGEHWIILEPEHVATIARMAGFVPSTEVGRACERLQDRLHLLAGLIQANASDNAALCAAAEHLLDWAAKANDTQRAEALGMPHGQGGCAQQFALLEADA